MLTTRILLTIALFLAATPAWATHEDLDINCAAAALVEMTQLPRESREWVSSTQSASYPGDTTPAGTQPTTGGGGRSPAPAEGRGNEVIDQNTGERLKMTRVGMGPSDPVESLWGSADNPLPRASRKPWGSPCP